MDTTPASQLLTLQHRKIDAGVQAVANGDGQPAALEESLTLLRLHIYTEERYVFPPLVESGLAMPVFVMKKEHGEMWPLLQALSAACASAAPLDAQQGTALALFRLLQIHNTKEEDIVYTAADRLVAGYRGEALLETLENAQIPDGWVCAMAPK